MRYWWVPLLLLVLCTPANAVIFIGGGGGAAAPAQRVATAGTDGASFNSAYANANYYFVGTRYNPPADVGPIDQLDQWFRAVDGDPSAYTFTAVIYVMDGSDDLSTLVATSEGVNGGDLTGGEFTSFTFASPPQLSNGTNYFMGTTMNAIDASKNADPSYGDGAWDDGGTNAVSFECQSDGTCGGAGGAEYYMKLYYVPQ